MILDRAVVTSTMVETGLVKGRQNIVLGHGEDSGSLLVADAIKMGFLGRPGVLSSHRCNPVSTSGLNPGVLTPGNIYSVISPRKEAETERRDHD